ncbi:MAG: dTDP-4-dehydrorhamnose reductase [Rhodobacteraceae bacterium CG17_big_fil_post_rev_8_21_14_2_50_63_15]|nr:dTDP-4-dehydrorhamnose reductase [Roseovarius sp.]PIV79580.1 MAG: dTDP-4-dehydrorhamnose reductase [Rhodobacteraceae bacterium CG17_big_fil_post_rev_8_21_14_2_50_63_15]
MTLLIFGQTGQVARELAALRPEALFLGRDQANLEDPVACAAAIRAQKPDAVINAAAYTAVDRAESEEALAMRVNAAAPGAMAGACAMLGIPFVQISTDYVFDGGGRSPRKPTDPVAPQNAYGRSKRAGEEAVQAAAGTYAILRTSWVFSAHGGNFVKTMLRLSETRDALGIVEDQIGGPTPAADIARACLLIMDQLSTDPGKRGIYHFSGAPDVSWLNFAKAIFAEARRSVVVTGIPTADYPTPARRPLNSRLDCQSTLDVFGIERPDWRTGLRTCLKQLDFQ